MDKKTDLLTALVHSPGPVSGEDLAARLGVSSRTVRNYVRSLNRRAALISATHRGYVLNKEVYESQRGTVQIATETPATRLQFICRHLAKHSQPTSVYDLAEELFVSESTLESDLTRARDVLREHDLVLRRDRSMVWAEGQERSRRRLVRQMLKGPAGGLMSATWKAFCSEYDQYDVRGLRDDVATLVDSSELEFNEYALADLVMHLVVTVERVRQGSVLPVVEGRTIDYDERLLALCHVIGELVAQRYQVTLPPAELDGLYGVLAVRAVRGAEPSAAGAVIDPAMRALVGELMDEVADQYLLGPSDRSLLLNLTLHVQNLVARARSGTSLLNPLGEDFKNDHPLVHDLALCFAGKLEGRLGIEVDPGELDYLSFHMGLQYMRYLEERDLVTVTLVVPRYYDLAERLAAKLGDTLRGQAVVEDVATSIDYDFATATSDLIVSCIEPEGPTGAPVVVISPFLTPRDNEQLLDSVRRERERNARRRVRTALTTLIDPRVFFHTERVGSREAAIGIMCDALVDAGYVGPSFYSDVLEREYRSSTHFGGEFAIPHSMYMDAMETGIAVLVSDKGIPWGASLVRLVFLVALSPDGRGTFRDVLEEITRLLASHSSVAALVAGSNGFEEFMSSLSRLIEGDGGALPATSEHDDPWSGGRAPSGAGEGIPPRPRASVTMR